MGERRLVIVAVVIGAVLAASLGVNAYLTQRALSQVGSVTQRLVQLLEQETAILEGHRDLIGRQNQLIDKQTQLLEQQVASGLYTEAVDAKVRLARQEFETRLAEERERLLAEFGQNQEVLSQRWEQVRQELLAELKENFPELYARVYGPGGTAPGAGGEQPLPGEAGGPTQVAFDSGFPSSYTLEGAIEGLSITDSMAQRDLIAGNALNTAAARANYQGAGANSSTVTVDSGTALNQVVFQNGALVIAREGQNVYVSVIAYSVTGSNLIADVLGPENLNGLFPVYGEGAGGVSGAAGTAGTASAPGTARTPATSSGAARTEVRGGGRRTILPPDTVSLDGSLQQAQQDAAESPDDLVENLILAEPEPSPVQTESSPVIQGTRVGDTVIYGPTEGVVVEKGTVRSGQGNDGQASSGGAAGQAGQGSAAGQQEQSPASQGVNVHSGSNTSPARPAGGTTGSEAGSAGGEQTGSTAQEGAAESSGGQQGSAGSQGASNGSGG